MWTIKPPPLLRVLGFVLLVSHLTFGQLHRPPPPPPPRLIPFSNHGGHNFNVQEDSSSSEEDSDSESDSTGQVDPDHYPQSYPNIGYRSKVPVGASHSPHQLSDPFTRPPSRPLQPPQGHHQHGFPQQMTETTPATLEEIEASYEDSLLRLKTQGKLPFNSQEFSSPQFFDHILDHHHYNVPPPQLGVALGNHPSFPPVGTPLKAPFKPSAPFSPNFESTSGFKPSFGPPVKGPLGIPTFTLGTSGLRPGHVLESAPQQHGPLSATYIPSSRPNLFKDLAITYPPIVVGGGHYTLDSSQLPDESKKTSHSVSIQSSHVPSPSSHPHVSPVKEEYKVIFVKPPTTTHSPYRAAPPIVLKQSRGPLSKPSESNNKNTNKDKLVAKPPQRYYPTQDVSSSQDSPLRPEEQAVLYHLFSKTDGQTTTTTTTTVATPPSTSTTTNVYLAEEPHSSPVSTLADYSFGDILKLPQYPLKPKKKLKSNKDKATAYSISHPYIIPLKSPKVGINHHEPDIPPNRRLTRKNRLIPVDEDSGFMLTYAPTYSPVASASTTIPTFVDYTQHGNEVEELLKAYGVQPKDKTKEGHTNNVVGPTSIEDPPTFYTSTTAAPSTTSTSTSTTPFPFKRIKAKPPTEPTTTISTTTTTEYPSVRTRGTTTESTARHSSEGSVSRKSLKNNQISNKKEKDDADLSDEYEEEEESRYASKEKGTSAASLPESDEDYEGGEAESSEEYSEEEEQEQPAPKKSKTKNNKQTSKEIDDRPKTLDERKRKNVQEDSSSEEDEEEEEESKANSSDTTPVGRNKAPTTLPMFYEPTKAPKRRDKSSDASGHNSKSTNKTPKEVQRKSTSENSNQSTGRSKSKRNKSKDSSEEEEEQVNSKITITTTHQPRIGKKPSIEMILDSVRNSTISSDTSADNLGKKKSSKSKRQRIKPSVAKRLQKSGSKKIRKVRRKNKRKKTRAS